MSRSFLCLPLVIYLAGCASTQRDRVYLDAALQTAAWIQSVEVPTDAGKTWPSNPEDPKSISTDLYSGSPGVVLFFLEAYHATGKRAYLADAREGADDLLAQVWEAPEDLDASLYSGLSGIGFALLETYKTTGDERYRVGVGRIVDHLSATARKRGDGVEWSDVTDIIGGSAGTSLFLLRAAHTLDRPDARELAIKAGRRLITLGIKAEHGKKWRMSPDFPRLMPNFSHGTAGISYFLVELYDETREPLFLDASLAGARYLKSVAKTEDGGCLIFHHEPEGEDLFYLGWCHGPVGTARLFYRLAEVTGDSEWTTWFRKSVRALLTSGIPEQRLPGFWNNVSQCCGDAGVAQFFLDLYRVTRKREYLDFSRHVAAEVLRRATATEAGLKWIQAEHRVRPELLVAQTGYMQGAAGIGLLLLHLDAVERNRQPRIIFPDSPFR